MRALLLCALMACSTWRQQTATGGGTLQIADGKVRGGEIGGYGQVNGIGLSLAVTGQMLERDEASGLHRRDFSSGMELGMTFSPFAFFAPNDRVTRWFDFGVAGALNGGLVYPGRLTTYGESWGGGWLQIGLSPAALHPSLIVSVRRDAVLDWDNSTVFTISLAVTRRAEQGPPQGTPFL